MHGIGFLELFDRKKELCLTYQGTWANDDLEGIVVKNSSFENTFVSEFMYGIKTGKATIYYNRVNKISNRLYHGGD